VLPARALPARALPVRALAALAVSALLVAGCGSSDGTPGAAGTAPGTPSATAAPASPSPVAVPLAEQSPEEILAAAKRALSEARSVRVRGELTENGKSVGLDLAVKRSQGARGTITAEGFTFDLVRVGKQAFVRSPKSFYAQEGGAQVAAVLAGKYVKASAGDKYFSSILAITSASGLQKLLSSQNGELTRTDVRTVAGQQVVGLEDASGVLYVATTSSRPVQLAARQPGGSEGDPSKGGKLDFLDYDEPVDLQVPDDVIDPQALGR